MNDQLEAMDDEGMHLAVVGMTGRFPRVSGLSDLWDAVAAGTDLLTRYPAHPDGTVSAFGAVPEADRFDAAFFGISPHEARAMDPQHRVFLECAWEALEHAGHDPARFPGRIGVYGGAAETEHMVALHSHPEVLAPLTSEERHLACDLSYLTTRAAFHLGLTGPCVTVLSHCASALLAVHTAGQALLGGECDLALAGGVTMLVPQPDDIDAGDGAISGDGHVRTFDARADGVVVSNGAAILALRRLEDAVADGDHVHAVIRGSAVNNDGNRKNRVGTPSVESLTEVMRAAHGVAGVTAETIDYVEATYGASPKLANPIEMAALRRVFAGRDRDVPRCRLGSVMSHVGHTEAVCGAMAMLILIEGLRHDRLPGTAHFEQPDPELDLESGPFEISATTAPWPRTGSPRRAAVTNSGRGGTNVHLVLEEPPPAPARPGTARPQLLPLSARDPLALRAAARRLADSLSRTPQPIEDVAWTLQSGRSEFSVRGFAVVTGDHSVSGALTERLPVARASDTTVVFACGDDDPSRLPAIGDLYEHEAAFRSAIDECVAGADPRAAVLDAPEPSAARLVATQYALGRLYEDWGIRPELIVSEGLGHHAAAALCGIVTPAEAVAAAAGGRAAPAPSATGTIPWTTTEPVTDAGPAEARRLVLGLGPAVRPSGFEPSVAALGTGTEAATTAALTALGWLWARGIAVDWPKLHRGPRPRRVPLPTYPFARRRFRLDEAPATAPRGPARPRWLLTRGRRTDARLRLYCFPHSGGAAGEYMRWDADLPGVEVWGLQLPGRGGRAAEAPITSLPVLADRIADQVDFAEPFAFFGHSFGALLAFEVARRLRDRDRTGPRMLCLSACRAPDDDLATPSPIYTLDDAEFIAEMERLYGPLPTIFHEDQDLRSIAMPSLRADIEAAEEYRHTPGSPLDCPIVVTGGTDDTEDENRLRRWKAHTTAGFRARMFPGGHFYLRDRPREFLSFLGETLAGTGDPIQSEGT